MKGAGASITSLFSMSRESRDELEAATNITLLSPVP